jgi:hypothetical protein
MTWAHIQSAQGVQGASTPTPIVLTLSAAATAGNFGLVSISLSSGYTITSLTDSVGNSYTQDVSITAHNPPQYLYHSVMTTGGAFTLTAVVTGTGAMAGSMTFDEYSFAAGTISVASTCTGFLLSSTGTTLTASSALTWSAPKVLIAGAIAVGNASTITPTGPITTRQSITDNPGTNSGIFVEDGLNILTSGQTIGATLSGDAAATIVGAAYASSGDTTSPTFTVSPSTIPANHSGNITLTLVGSNTAWVNGTTVFTLPTITGLTKVSQSITSATAATIVCTTGATTGSGNITDNTDSATAALTVSTATLAISPTTGAISTPASLTLTGTHTLWSSETASTLFTASGGTSPSISSITVTSNTAATATLNPGSSAGTITVTDSSTTAAASFTATGSSSSLAVSPTSVVQNSTGLTLTLTGTGTSWTAGTPGTPTFTVSAGTITAQTITSATAATLTYSSPASSSSPVTITDPSTGATASLTISASNLANGTASTVSVGNTIATVTVGNATGGTPPYSYQWYRSTTSGFTPGSGNIVAGATNQTLNDTGLTNGTEYFYVNIVTDSA